MIKNSAAVLDLGVAHLAHFQGLIAERTGLFFSERKWNTLRSAIVDFGKDLKIKDLNSLYKLLANSSTEGDTWKLFITKLTINETFFFRHFKGIENRLLPEIIQRNKNTRTLRIWSAGCSSGEEPFSIAMALKRLIPDIDLWNIYILATDIDETVLEQGRKGKYREWSMRQIPPFYLQNYLKKSKGEYRLDPEIKKLVHFDYLNLKENGFPSAANGTNNMDIILCRNVTIYFEAQDTIRIAGNFYEALNKGGKLIVGHSEPSSFIYNQYRSEILEDIVIYNKDMTHHSVPKPLRQKIKPPKDRRLQVSNDVTKLKKKAGKDKKTVFGGVERRLHPNLFEMRKSALKLIEQNKLEEAAKIFDKLIILNQKDAYLYFISGNVEAKLGNFAKADSRCQKALSINENLLDALLLRSIIAKEQWELDTAKKYTRHLILKDSDYLPAYLELFQIAHLEDNDIDKKRLSKKIKLQAKKLDPKKKYDILEGLTVSQIVEIVKVMGQE